MFYILEPHLWPSAPPYRVCGKPLSDLQLYTVAKKKKMLKFMSRLPGAVRNSHMAALRQPVIWWERKTGLPLVWTAKQTYPQLLPPNSGLSSLLEKKRDIERSVSGEKRISETSNSFFKLKREGRWAVILFYKYLKISAGVSVCMCPSLGIFDLRNGLFSSPHI